MRGQPYAPWGTNWGTSGMLNLPIQDNVLAVRLVATDKYDHGFVDRKTGKILGCQVVGERAVDIAQVAAIAIAAGMRVDDLARVSLSYPTYAAILTHVAASAARRLAYSG